MSSMASWFRRQSPVPSMDGETSITQIDKQAVQGTGPNNMNVGDNVPSVQPVMDSGLGTANDNNTSFIKPMGNVSDEDIDITLPKKVLFKDCVPSSTPHHHRQLHQANENDGMTYPFLEDRYISKKKVEKDLAKFTGKSDWCDYMSHFDAVATWNDWNYRDRGLQLAISLTDEAREVLAGLAGSQKYDYDILVDELTRRFSPSGRESQYSLELMNRTCRHEEDVTSYGHAIRRLAAKAYPGKRLDQKLLVDLYIRGLPNQEIKRYVYLEKPEQLSEAIGCAVAYEAFDKPTGDKPRKPKPVVAVVQSKTLNKSTDNPHIASISKSHDNAVADLATTVKDIQATVCELKNELNKMNKAKQNTSSFSGNRPFSKSNVECYNCHNRGHYARECPRNNTQFQNHPMQQGPHNGNMQNTANPNVGNGSLN